MAANRDRVALSLLAIPLIALLLDVELLIALSFFASGHPYSLVVQQCRDHGRCTPAALGRGVSEKLRHQLALEPAQVIWAMKSYDRRIVADAKRLIDRFAAAEQKSQCCSARAITAYQMLSELALMYADKWHTWPRSFTFSDELVPRLVERIMAAPVRLRSGDIVIVRRNEAEELGTLEAGVLKLILSSGYLCSLEGQSDEVVAYRFYRHDDPSHSSNDCAGRLFERQSVVADANKPDEILRELPALIRNIQNSAATLPNGAVDLAALRRANVEVPKLFVRGGRLATPPGPMQTSPNPETPSRSTFSEFIRRSALWCWPGPAGSGGRARRDHRCTGGRTSRAFDRRAGRASLFAEYRRRAADPGCATLIKVGQRQRGSLCKLAGHPAWLGTGR